MLLFARHFAKVLPAAAMYASAQVLVSKLRDTAEGLHIM